MAACCRGYDIWFGNLVYDWVAYQFEFIPRNYSIHPEDEPIEFDPEKQSEKDLIVEQNRMEAEALEMNSQLQIKKFRYFIICTVSNAIGLVLTLFGLGKTVLFQQFGSNPPLFYCSILFYIPFLAWVIWLCCPGRRITEQRKYIRDRRIWRKAVDRRRKKLFLGLPEDSDEELEMGTHSKKGAGRESTRASSIRNSSVQLGGGGGGMSGKKQSSVILSSNGLSVKDLASSGKNPSMKSGPPLETKRTSVRFNDEEKTGGGGGAGKKGKRISFSV
jgi:hypothetical protein